MNVQLNWFFYMIEGNNINKKRIMLTLKYKLRKLFCFKQLENAPFGCSLLHINNKIRQNKSCPHQIFFNGVLKEVFKQQVQ